MTPRQLTAVLEHSGLLDRMQDARDLFVGLLAGSGNEKEVTKYHQAWSEGRAPADKPKREQVTEEEKVKLMAMRDLFDSERAAKNEKPN